VTQLSNNGDQAMSKPDFSTLAADNIVAFLADIFARRGNEEYLGEAVTMAEHMLQGAHFAKAANESEAVIVAVLLHDIGHFISEFGTFSMDDTQDRYHEEAGALALQPFFPSLVIDCVRFHVSAKRYLCATRPEYFKRLSEASIHSLNLQGGPMNAEEVAIFKKKSNLRDIIKVRYFDDEGKQVSMKAEPFSHYMPMIQRVVDRHCA